MFFLYFDRILILAAIVPAIFLLVKIYQADRSEKEPPQLLGSLILRGIFATMIAIVLERLASGGCRDGWIPIRWNISWWRIS